MDELLHNERHCLPKADCLSNLWNDVEDKGNVALGKLYFALRYE